MTRVWQLNSQYSRSVENQNKWENVIKNPYVKQKALDSGHIIWLVIQVHSLHINVHAFRHALLDGVDGSAYDQPLGQNTFQSSLAVSPLSVYERERKRTSDLMNVS